MSNCDSGLKFPSTCVNNELPVTILHVNFALLKQGTMFLLCFLYRSEVPAVASGTMELMTVLQGFPAGWRPTFPKSQTPASFFHLALPGDVSTSSSCGAPSIVVSGLGVFDVFLQLGRSQFHLGGIRDVSSNGPRINLSLR